MVHVLQGRLAGSVSLHIAHVTHMALRCVRSGMWFVRWIKMSAGRSGVCRTAVAEFMNVKAMVAGSQACKVCMNLHAIGLFGEDNRTADFVARRGMKHGDRLYWRRRFFLRLRLYTETCER